MKLTQQEQYEIYEYYNQPGITLREASQRAADITAAKMATASGWISTKDRLPKKEDGYDGKTTNRGDVLRYHETWGLLSNVAWFNVTVDNCTHWMQIPPLPVKPEPPTLLEAAKKILESINIHSGEGAAKVNEFKAAIAREESKLKTP